MEPQITMPLLSTSWISSSASCQIDLRHLNIPSLRIDRHLDNDKLTTYDSVKIMSFVARMTPVLENFVS